MSEPDNTARPGKIGRLPARVRQALNERLRDGAMGPEILPWLNGLAEVRAVLEQHFAGAEISPQNLSEWRLDAYKKWLQQREREERLKRLSEQSYGLAQAGGGSMSAGAIAVAGGEILQVLESVADLPMVGDPKNGVVGLQDVIESLVNLRHAEIATDKVGLARLAETRKRDELDLTRQKFRRQTAEMFIEYFLNRKAREVMDSGVTGETRLNQIAELMFGANPFASTSA